MNNEINSDDLDINMFETWDDKLANAINVPLWSTIQISEITEPPCKNCCFFNPIRKVSLRHTIVEVSGVKVCHSKTMFNDYSCYEEKRNE